MDRPPGQKVAIIVERGEKRYSEAAIGHGVQKAMTCRRQEQITPSPNRAQTRRSFSHESDGDNARKQSRKREGMRKPSVPQKSP